MAMPLGFAAKVSLFSMRKRIIRTILSLLPCVLLIAIMFIGSTIPNGLVNELDSEILSKAQSRQEYVSLDSYLFSQPDFTKMSAGMTVSSSSSTFDQQKYDLATRSPYVEAVYPQQGSVSGIAPKIGNVSNGTLNLSGTSAEYAKLYTPEPFKYGDGQPIPVLINPSSIAANTYNWDGKNTLDIDYGNAKDAQGKSSYVQLVEGEKLVGTTFKVNFGTFPNWPEAFEEQTMNGFGPPKSKLTKITDSDKDIIMKRLKEIYGEYWDISKFNESVTAEFKVVGVLNGQTAAQALIPNEAIPAIWNKLYARQLAARTTKAIDKEVLSSDSGKVEVVDGFISENAGMTYSTPTWQKSPEVSAWQVDISQIGIPGLLVEPTKNAKGQNEYKPFEQPIVGEQNFKKSAAIVKLKSADDREAYMTFLKDNGMQIYDNSPVAIIKSVRKGANIFVTWLTIILGTIVAFILLTTVSRFVADSRKEIGVWRAIGAKRIDITVLVLVRMLILLAFGVFVGVAIGYGLSALIARSIVSSVNSYTGSINVYSPTGGNFLGSLIVGMLGGEVPKLELVKLLAPNWPLLLSRLGILSLITLVVGLIPASRASRISPVTAIRDSE
jgi:ABC-type lipoprotein release transport system permease subunit